MPAMAMRPSSQACHKVLPAPIWSAPRMRDRRLLFFGDSFTAGARGYTRAAELVLAGGLREWLLSAV